MGVRGQIEDTKAQQFAITLSKLAFARALHVLYKYMWAQAEATLMLLVTGCCALPASHALGPLNCL